MAQCFLLYRHEPVCLTVEQAAFVKKLNQEKQGMREQVLVTPNAQEQARAKPNAQEQALANPNALASSDLSNITHQIKTLDAKQSSNFKTIQGDVQQLPKQLQSDLADVKKQLDELKMSRKQPANLTQSPPPPPQLQQQTNLTSLENEVSRSFTLTHYRILCIAIVEVFHPSNLSYSIHPSLAIC